VPPTTVVARWHTHISVGITRADYGVMTKNPKRPNSLRDVDSGIPAPDGVGVISWANSNSTQFERILRLYARPGFSVADITYGKGTFWKDVDTDQYRTLLTDFAVDGVDASNLPYDDDSLDMVVFDPPYRYVERTSTASHTDDQYRLTETLKASRSGLDGVLDLYREGIAESERVLKVGGYLVVKCQDTVADGKQTWVHVKVMQWCEEVGCTPVDLAVVVTPSPPPTRWKIQKTMRKAHSYFIVARKGGTYPFGYKSVQTR
jgi:hypothetical protein